MQKQMVKLGKLCLAFCLVLLLCSYSYGNEKQAIEECLQSAHSFRFAWCDALRGEISLSEWTTEGEKYLASTMTSRSNQPNLQRTYNSREEYLDEQSGYIASSLSTLDAFQICINNFGANYIGSQNEDSDLVSVKVPTTRVFKLVNDTKLVEYDVDIYKCRKEGRRWKINFWNDEQGLTTLLD